MSWEKVDEQPLEPSVSGSPMAVTESQDVPGQIRMFRGTTRLAFGVDAIALAVSAPEARMKWVERMAEDRLIDGSIESGEWTSYEAYDLIWPVSNRDYVFRQTLEKSEQDGKNRTVVSVASIEHPDFPPTSDRVRGSLPTCVFTLDEVSETETDLKVVVQVDPGGSLPEFVKNVIQKGWALKTMRALNTYMGHHSG
ncbi:MAG: hypothetical protein CL927_07615 [Deltaproteobacteria bacterium]|nr:hypothetical protein [Deltaproteobacteria bacterium]HCH65544.1 hypothetical protein [Deltaproteobacteria bacterium]